MKRRDLHFAHSFAGEKIEGVAATFFFGSLETFYTWLI